MGFYDSLFDKEYFEEAQGSNYFGYVDLPVFKRRAEEILKLNPKRVLEIGCAKGFTVRHMCDLGIDAYGVDISAWALKNCDESVKNRLQWADVTADLPFGDKTFDLVVSWDVLEHIKEAHLFTAVREIVRVGVNQRHWITCEEYQIGCDATHFTIRPYSWWVATYPELNPLMSD